MSLYSLNSSNIIIFDWDDTLCPTTSLNIINSIKNNIYVDNEILNKNKDIRNSDIMKVEINKIDEINIKLLQKSNQIGNIVIITNAHSDWIKFSGMNYLPLTYNFIIKNNIPIISARELSLKNNIENPNEWKNYTFHIYLNHIFTHDINTIMTVGDSNLEHLALNKYNNFMKSNGINIIIKTIKYIEQPIVQDIYKQNIVLINNIDSILSNPISKTLYIKPSS